MPHRNPRPLPVSMDDINPDWLTGALRTRAPGVTVRDAQVVDVNRGTCTKIRLRLSLDEAGRRAGIPEVVILKGGFEPHSRELWYMHEAEARGYRDVYTVLELPTPACYFADYDETRKQGIIIMEDLVARGVRFCSALRPESFQSVARRLSTLAKFHAQTWGGSDLEPGGRWSWLPQCEFSLKSHLQTYLVPETWKRFIDSPRGAATSVKFHDLELIINAYDRLVAFTQDLPHCVTHGDAHPGNLFEYSDGSPGFFDSLPGRGAGMRDVAYHIVGAVDTANRRQWEGALVQHYLNALRQNGIHAPDFDEAMTQYRAFLLPGFIIFMVNESFWQPESINTAYTSRFSAALIDHDTTGFLTRAS